MLSTTLRKRSLQFLKLIGVALFLWILSRIDRTALLSHLQSVNPWNIVFSFAGLYFIYACKAARWHLLVRSTGLRPSLADSWRLFHIGIFLGAITPANLGEMGRAAYLRRMGAHTGTALALPLIDRITDVFVMGAMGIWSMGLLFGWHWSFVVGITSSIVAAVLMLLWRKAHGLRAKEWLAFLNILAQPTSLACILFWTLLSWTAYFVWAFIIAQSIGIEVGMPVLMATLTIAGILAFIPIAPSGLGTRETAFIALLAPYGIAAPQAVAFALTMFLLIITGSSLGLWYWLHDRT